MDRTVRHLRVQAPTALEAQRLGDRLADSLRLADLHDGDGRLRFLRRVALGRVPAGASAATLAAAWERALATATSIWIHGGSRDATDADAIWFADALDAHLCLARRILVAAPVQAWYWAHAVPQWHPRMEVGAALRALVLGLLDRPEAPAALPAWFAALVSEGHADALPGLLMPSDVPHLHQRLGSGFSRAMEQVTRTTGGGTGVHPSMRDAPATTTTVLPAPPPEVLPSALLLMAGASRPAAWLPVAHMRPAASSTEGCRMSSPQAAITFTAPHLRLAPPATSAPAMAPQASGTGTGAGFDTPTPVLGAVHGAASMQADIPAGMPTLAGGLALLLPALRRLGYADWLEQAPEWGCQPVLPHLLGCILARLPVPADDPAWLLAAPVDPGTAAPSRFQAPARWMPALQRGQGRRTRRTGRHRLTHDRSGRLLLVAVGTKAIGRATGTPLPLQWVAGAWQVALHRYLRRIVGIGLHDVVMRTAQLTLSATHLDLDYRMAQVDVRLRRHGLDLDPGWLPWFGRVVTYRYRDGALP